MRLCQFLIVILPEVDNCGDGACGTVVSAVLVYPAMVTVAVFNIPLAAAAANAAAEAAAVIMEFWSVPGLFALVVANCSMDPFAMILAHLLYSASYCSISALEIKYLENSPSKFDKLLDIGFWKKGEQ